jgi:small subunit ribosomal protein S16
MATKIRLQRHGKKGKAFFHLVVADGRAPRDGRFIEKIGVYNPVTNPATIDINFDRAVHWVGVGATPTDTARAILSYKGVMMKDHLQRGVKKGALTQEQADAKFNAWLLEKESKVSGKKNKLASERSAALSAKLAQETAQKEARAKAIAEKAKAAEEAPATTENEESTDSAETAAEA